MPVTTILILTANPSDTTRLALDEEVRDIKAKLECSTWRDQFEVIAEGAVRINDLVSALQKYKPQIVHFSGHGAGEQGLVLVNDEGKHQLVPNIALRELFCLYRSITRCVFLNACYSETQAEEIYQHIDCVIGMNRPIGDKTAIQFAPIFYAALAEGLSFQDAFDQAKVSLKLGSNKEANTPIQKIRQGAKNLFSTANSDNETTATSSPMSQPTSNTSDSSSVNITGSSNIVSRINGGGNEVNQTIRQSTVSPELEDLMPALNQLKQAIANSDALSSREKKRAKGDVEFIEEEVQKQKPDKSEVAQSIADLKQVLSSVVTLAEPVTKVAELLAKAWIG